MSIIYIKTSQLSEEKIAVGAIGVFGSKLDIVISNQKLNVAFDLLQGKNKRFVMQNLNLFQNKVREVNIKSDGKAEKIDISVAFDKNYLSYLNAYSQGLIGFSAPMPVNINPSGHDDYRAFMKRFVGGFTQEGESSKKMETQKVIEQHVQEKQELIDELKEKNNTIAELKRQLEEKKLTKD